MTKFLIVFTRQEYFTIDTRVFEKSWRLLETEMLQLNVIEFSGQSEASRIFRKLGSKYISIVNRCEDKYSGPIV